MKLLLLLPLLAPLLVTGVANAVGYKILPTCPNTNNPWQSYADTTYQIGAQINAAEQAGDLAKAGSLQQSFDYAVNAYAAAEGPCVE